MSTAQSEEVYKAIENIVRHRIRDQWRSHT